MESLKAEQIQIQPEEYKAWLDNLLNPPTIKDVYDAIKGANALDTQINIWYKRLLKNYDLPIAITGYEGTGKSTLAIIYARKMARKTGTLFDLEHNVLYNPSYEQAIRILQSVQPMSSVVIDEAIRIMYVRNWNDKNQKRLNQLFTIIREKRLFVLICIPAFAELDSFFRQNRILLWIHIFVRGKACLFSKIPNPFAVDAFNVGVAKRIIDVELGRKMYRIEDTIAILKDKLPNFVMYFTFKQLPERLEKQYIAFKRKYTIELPLKDKEEELSRLDVLRGAIVDLYQSSPEWSIKKLAKKYNLTDYRVRQFISEAKKEASQQKKAGEDV